MPLSNAEIKDGQLRNFELHKESRQLTGYTLFLSFFFVEWKAISKKGRLDELGVTTCDEFSGSDDDSIESHQYYIDHVDVIRHAVHKWRSQSRYRKKCLGVRAGRLNQAPVLGKFTQVPYFLDNELLCHCLTMEWRRTCKILRGAIMREPTRIGSQRRYAMTIPGGEKTKVGNQSFCRAYMSPIIHLCLFGKEYEKLSDDEVIYRKKHCAIVHLCSNTLMKEMFGVLGLCGVEHYDNGIVHTCAGKVYATSNGKRTSGFVMSERRNRWVVKMMNNDDVVFRKIKYNDGVYKYDDDGGGGGGRITEYQPI